MSRIDHASSNRAPMHRHVAFLRAINVGRRRVKMERLRELFEGLGLSHVTTFIASGNVVFDSDRDDPGALELEIEEQLQVGLGYQVMTFIRSALELATIAGTRPFLSSPEDSTALAVAFLKQAPDPSDELRLLELRSEIDDFHVHQREIYWLRRGGFRDSTFSGAVLERTIRGPATVRNISTVAQLAALVPPSPSNEF